MISGLSKTQKKNFTLVTVANFLLFCNFSSLFLQPLFIKHLGGSETVIGFVMGSFGLTSLGSMPFVGSLIDRYGRRKFLLAGGVVMVAGTLGNIFISEIDALIFIPRLLQGIGFGFFFTSAATAASDYLPQSKRAQGLGIFGAFTIAAYAVGPPIGEAVISQFGFSPFFLTTSLFTVMALFLVLFIEDADIERSENSTHFDFFRLAFSRRFAVVLLTNLSLAGSFGAVLNFIASYLKSMELNTYIFFTTYAVTVTAIRFFGARVADRIDRKRIIAPSLLFFSFAVAGLAVISSELSLFIMALVFSFSYGMLYPTLTALVIDKAAPNERGKAVGAFNAYFSFGINFLAFGFGMVADRWGYERMYVIASVFAFLGFLLFSLGERRGETARDTEGVG